MGRAIPIWIIAAAFAMTACSGTEKAADPEAAPADVLESSESASTAVPLLRTSLFTAEYFNGETPVHTELVARPAANYDHSNGFLNIPPENFRAVWSGEVEVAHRALVNVHFDLSYSAVTLEVDGAPVAAWDELTSVTNPLVLEPGKHRIRISLKNLAWHVQVNIAFAVKPMLSAAAVAKKIKPLVTPDARIVYVGTYKSADFYNELALRLPAGPTPVILVVSSFHAVNWKLVDSSGANIRAVIYGSHDPVSTFAAPPGVPTLNVEDIGYAYENFQTMESAIVGLTGRAPDAAVGAYAAREVTVP